MLKQINTAYYQIELLPHYKITPTLMSPPSQQVPKARSPPLLEIEGTPTYNFRILLDSKRLGNITYYLIDCEGYGPEECFWILDPSLIVAFQ